MTYKLTWKMLTSLQAETAVIQPRSQRNKVKIGNLNQNLATWLTIDLQTFQIAENMMIELHFNSFKMEPNIDQSPKIGLFKSSNGTDELIHPHRIRFDTILACFQKGCTRLPGQASTGIKLKTVEVFFPFRY